MRQLEDCALWTDDCSKHDKPAGILDCHHFYKCDNGKAYKCQNPKLGYSTCSQTYGGIHMFGQALLSRTKEDYKCPKPKDSPAHATCKR